MTTGTQLQWGLLIGYTALLGAAVYVGLRRPRLRPSAFGVGVLAFVHAGYYVCFLLLRPWVSGDALMLMSIIIRYQVLFAAALLLLLAIRRSGWKS